jgi:hypothetical protein
VPQEYLRNGVVAASGDAVVVGWDGTIVRFSEVTCAGKPNVPIATTETGVTLNRLDGIWGYPQGKSTTIYAAGADGVIIRGD